MTKEEKKEQDIRDKIAHNKTKRSNLTDFQLHRMVRSQKNRTAFRLHTRPLFE